MSLDQLLQESDYVSLHAALTQENRHMIGLDQFKKMKRTAYFVNTARGALVDEQALFTALSEGYIAGAALDVMETEPPSPDNPLLGLENVIITPHTAQYSDQSEEELWRQPWEEVARILRGNWPRAFVNPQVKDKFLAKWGELKMG
jgi:D-3-phosphoglycerate dehydrogenase